ncbi:MAG TPA: transketolase [Elusimicrobiota bacterium]|nr:transketolase [Elusimicrobiota bacterium]
MKKSAVSENQTRDLDQTCIQTIRMLAVDAIEQANSGHPGMPMESAALGYLLWTQFLKHNPRNPLWENRDRFVLSAGHGSMLLYGLLHLTGYDVTLDDLRHFRQWGSKTPGHPEYGCTAGVETSTGPLAQGFSNGVGMAMAEKFLAARYNRPGFDIVNYHVYALVSDGDLMEGLSSEAASLAGHLRLSKLIYVYLDNRITIEGSTQLTFTEDTAKRFEAYGWNVVRVDDGNDLKKMSDALSRAKGQDQKPSLIMARTHLGYGSPNKQDTAAAHGSPLGAAEVKATKQALGWPLEPSFHVPAEVLAVTQRQVRRGADEEQQWRSVFDGYSKKYPELAKEWSDLKNTPLRAGWEKAIPLFKAGEQLATRQASGKVINALAASLPTLIGGSADLASSTETVITGGGEMSAETPAGRNIHFGVREHAMAGLMNGMALTRGVIPFGGTFLVFSAYMLPSIRLAAMMRLGVVYVFTHDSIGLGEDGPSHQPIEQLAQLRSIPHMVVLRPVDATETAEAWKIALERREAPTCLVLTRQKLPVLDRSKYASASGVSRGGYVLSDPSDGKYRAIIMATGSEIHLALSAQERLAQEGLPVRVVNMASWELFDSQPEEYRTSVLPPGVRARLAVEAGSSMGWHRYVGESGDIVSIDRFGASAPAGVLFEKYGFTAENVATRVRRMIDRNNKA